MAKEQKKRYSEIGRRANKEFVERKNQARWMSPGLTLIKSRVPCWGCLFEPYVRKTWSRNTCRRLQYGHHVLHNLSACSSGHCTCLVGLKFTRTWGLKFNGMCYSLALWISGSENKFKRLLPWRSGPELDFYWRKVDSWYRDTWSEIRALVPKRSQNKTYFVFKICFLPVSC